MIFTQTLNGCFGCHTMEEECSLLWYHFFKRMLLRNQPNVIRNEASLEKQIESTDAYLLLRKWLAVKTAKRLERRITACKSLIETDYDAVARIFIEHGSCRNHRIAPIVCKAAKEYVETRYNISASDGYKVASDGDDFLWKCDFKVLPPECESKERKNIDINNSLEVGPLVGEALTYGRRVYVKEMMSNDEQELESLKKIYPVTDEDALYKEIKSTRALHLIAEHEKICYQKNTKDLLDDLDVLRAFLDQDPEAYRKRIYQKELEATEEFRRILPEAKLEAAKLQAQWYIERERCFTKHLGKNGEELREEDKKEIERLKWAESTIDKDPVAVCKAYLQIGGAADSSNYFLQKAFQKKFNICWYTPSETMPWIHTY